MPNPRPRRVGCDEVRWALGLDDVRCCSSCHDGLDLVGRNMMELYETHPDGLEYRGQVCCALWRAAGSEKEILEALRRKYDDAPED